MGRTILVADDQDVVRTYVEAILRKAGFRVLEAADGVDALQKIEHRDDPVDLLVTDIRMPRMDGVALARSVIGLFPELPILYMSGYSFDPREEKSIRSTGASAFLAKPFTPQALLTAVRGLLDNRKSSSGANG